jgi:hypothetical protein
MASLRRNGAPAKHKIHVIPLAKHNSVCKTKSLCIELGYYKFFPQAKNSFSVGYKGQETPSGTILATNYYFLPSALLIQK